MGLEAPFFEKNSIILKGGGENEEEKDERYLVDGSVGYNCDCVGSL